MRAAVAGVFMGVCSALPGPAGASDCPAAQIAQSISKSFNSGEVCFPKGEIYVVPDKNPKRDGFRWMEQNQVNINRVLGIASQSFEVRDLPLADMSLPEPAIGKVLIVPTDMVNEPSYRELSDRHCVSLGTYEVDDIVSTDRLKGGADTFCLVHLTFRLKVETKVGRALTGLFFQSWGLGVARPERKARVLMRSDPFDRSWSLQALDQSNRHSPGFPTDEVGDLIRQQGLR
jgi:hypothetical protein